MFLEMVALLTNWKEKKLKIVIKKKVKKVMKNTQGIIRIIIWNQFMSFFPYLRPRELIVDGGGSCSSQGKPPTNPR